MKHETEILAGPGALALVGPGGRLRLDRKTAEALAEFFVSLLDIAEPDPDLEPIDEREPDGEENGYSWTERTDQSRHPYGGHEPATIGAHEDAEDDDADCGLDEGEPDFRRRRIKAGPGCIISDSDFGGEELGEEEYF